MVEWILIALMAVVISVLILFIWRDHKCLKEVYQHLERSREGDFRRMYATGKGVQAKIVFSVNALTERYREEIDGYRKAAESGDEILTGFSHDVRTPITSLIGYLDALDGETLTEEERKEYLAVCKRKATEIKSYVNLLFDWFKINSNELILLPRPTDVNELLRQIIIEWLPAFHGNGIQPCAQLSDESYLASLDDGAFRRVVNNLVKNAVDHAQCSRITIAAAQTETHIIVTVADDGDGIPPDKLPHIFERLYKCNDFRGDKGSGLGLSIARELILRQGGEITVKSEPNVGTEFTVTLPRINDEAQEL